MTLVKHPFTTDTPTTWQPTKESVKGKENSYDFDVVVDAYLTGRKEGFDHGLGEMQRGITKLLKVNSAIASTCTNLVLNYLREHDVITRGAFLKIVSWDELNILILVEQDCFLSPSFKDVYDLVYDLEETSEEDNLALSFSFAPYNSDFNKTCMSADGYSLRHKEEVSE